MTHSPRKNPSDSRAELINTALRNGRFGQAVGLLERLQSNSGLSPGQLTQLGFAYTMLQRYGRAETSFREAAERTPGPDTWSNLGNILRLQGNYQEAADITGKALRQDPGNQAARSNLAMIYRRLGRHEEAIELIRSLPAMDIEILLELSINYRMIRQVEKALQAAERAYQLAPDDPDVLLQYAISLDANDSRTVALEHLKSAASIQPQNSEIMTQLANLMELTGEVDNCRQICVEILESEPDNSLARLVMARLKFRDKDYTGTVDLLDEIDIPDSDSELRQQHLTLHGKCFDKLGQYDRAWDCFTKANRIKMSTTGRPELINRFYRQLEMLARQPSSSVLSEPETAAAKTADEDPSSARRDEPVFIVGLPRSGTTLLGYLLGRLPGITVLDEERLFFESALKVLGGNDAVRLLGITAQQAQKIAENYRELALLKGHDGKRLLVDKDPLNLVNVEVIRSVFPRARFIYITRHPYDVVLSIYMQNFADRSVLSQCNTIEQCVRFCHEVLATWEQIESRTSADILELRFEDFVDEPDAHLLKISRWLGEISTGQIAEPEQDLLSRIRTPSYVQVTEPINRSGVYRWKNYRHYLDGEVMAPLRSEAARYESGYHDLTQSF